MITRSDYFSAFSGDFSSLIFFSSFSLLVSQPDNVLHSLDVAEPKASQCASLFEQQSPSYPVIGGKICNREPDRLDLVAILG